MSEAMHAQLVKSARRHQDGLTDHVRYILAQGLKYQQALDANEDRVPHEMMKPDQKLLDKDSLSSAKEHRKRAG